MIGAWFWDQRRHLDRTEHELADAQNATEKMRGELSSLKEDLALERARIQELQSERKKVTQAHKSPTRKCAMPWSPETLDLRATGQARR